MWVEKEAKLVVAKELYRVGTVAQKEVRVGKTETVGGAVVVTVAELVVGEELFPALHRW